MLNGLDLFSGIGGITLALGEWVRPVAYCEQDLYCQGVLLSRMADGSIPCAPIWDDVRTLRGDMLPAVDIIYGGFPCQDISVAGKGAGMVEGNRSGLFYEIARLAGELRPDFIFLENVPAITLRGLEDVTGTLAGLGFDCRWIMLSAASVGANHLRQRWFCLAKHANSNKQYSFREISEGKIATNSGICSNVAHTTSGQSREPETRHGGQGVGRGSEEISNANSKSRTKSRGSRKRRSKFIDESWWSIEPNVGRVAHGIPFRMDRLKGLGNAVVPLQAREAFKMLMGIKC